MRAIRVHKFGDPSVLQWETVPDPKPGRGQVLIRSRAIGVNPIETYLRAGLNPKLPLPYTPGSDIGGEVIACGDEVKTFAPGARVYTSESVTGAYAEMVVAEVADVHPLPERFSFEDGASIGVPFATAYRALFHRGGLQASETLLIHGASGGVGTAAVQLARNAGATIIATAGTPEGEKLVRDLGANHVVNHRNPNYLKEILDLTGGAGVNAILEFLANVNLGNDLGLLAKKGRVVVVGSRGKVEILPRDLMGREADIRGVTLYIITPQEKVMTFAALNAGFVNGTLKPVIGQKFPLAEAARAHERIMAPDGAKGKIILTV